MSALLSSNPLMETGYALFTEDGRLNRPLAVNARVLTSEEQRSFRSTVIRVSPFASIASRLSRYRELPENWDSYGAMKISPTALAAADSLIDCLHSISLESVEKPLLPYHLSPTPDGGLQIEWRSDQGSFELWIDSAGALSAVVDQASAIPSASEKKFVSDASVAMELETFVR